MKFGKGWFYMLPLVVFLFLLPDAGMTLRASAQPKQQAQSKCPTVNVTCPDTVEVGGKPMFTVMVSGGDPQVTPTYNWTVSNGTISSGQGTSTIEVDTTGIAGNSTVTATVDVGGFSRECSTSASCTTSVMKTPDARKVDEYGSIRAKDGEARLDNFMIELQNDPTAQGYVIAYAGRRAKVGEAQRAADKAKGYLVKKRGAQPARVMTLDGGFREESMLELWIVPSGARPPQAMPSVDPSEVRLAKPVKSVKSAKPKAKKRKKA